MNTCAIREHAEQRVFGNLGALVHTKRRHPEQIICLCGCMAQAGPRGRAAHASPSPTWTWCSAPTLLWQFPELLLDTLTHRQAASFQIAGRARLHRRGHPRGAAGPA